MPVSPAGDAGRLELLDALRGFALLGILLVNVATFASAYQGSGIVDPAFDRPLDRAVRFIVVWLFEAKFYLLFSFLFGYSFTLQVRAAERAQAAFAPRLLRRLAALWVLGAVHFLLLFHGDILATYAVLGLALLALRRRSDRWLSGLAIALVAGTALLWALMGGLVAWWLPPDETQAARERAEAALQAYRGTPATVIAQHVRELPVVLAAIGLAQAPTSLAAFCIGLIAGRREWLARLGEQADLLRRMAVAGAAIGLPAAALYSWGIAYVGDERWSLLGYAWQLLLAPPLTAAYLASAILLLQAPASSLMAWLAPAGRMALSNYLMQSLVLAWVFHAYGLRLMGQLAPWAYVLLALALFGVQLVASRWGLQRHAYGPVEWLLRAATLAAWPRWRLAPGPR